MSEPQHCRDCDSTDCAGFQQRYTPEPTPALRPERVADEVQRAKALAETRAAIEAVRRRLQEGPK
jgi:hypothetical protein